MATPVLSIVIPAFNEAQYLPLCLPTVVNSLKIWMEASGEYGEIIVVDNDSEDETIKIAESFGARIVREVHRNIGQVRNTGATAAHGRYLLFVDADVSLPAEAVSTVMRLLASGRHVGGAIPPKYTPRRISSRLLCWYWSIHRKRHRGAQGVDQFCTADAFRQLTGYRTDWFMSEDVEFFNRLRDLGDRMQRPVAIVDELRVRPSSRRYDQWPAWKMIWWQNPITARLRLGSASFWRHWYQSTVR
ncbi:MULTISPECIES: glycosyltransferase [unclassified Streptomyces]|uniref:glycosyltransferase n=1 Tax=unclassified Streptomyces TaxID=2593676 RepID=UPI00324847EE